jgi:N-acetyl-gamma-glutamyl-phosphate reductase
MPGAPKVREVHAALADAYAGEPFVEVASLEESAGVGTLDPEGLNGSNRIRLHVFGNEKTGQARLVALFDNLGKGASGAAVQNLNLALGLEETAGL